MRLVFDAQCIQSTSSLRGIGRYSLCLLRALVQESHGHEVEVLLNGGDSPARLLRAREAMETFLPPGQIHVFDADWPWRHRMSVSRRRGAEAAYSAAIASLQPDVVVVGSVFEGDAENVLSVNVHPDDPPTAGILYDLIPAMDPGTYLLGPGAEVYWRRFEQFRRLDLLLSISDYSAGQARRLLDTPPPIETIWGGPYPSGNFPSFETQVDERPDLELPSRFLLSVGGDHPRKNLDRLVTAWSRVPRSRRRGTSLVIACGLNSGTVRRLRRLGRRGGIGPGELVLTGRVSDRTLQLLYRDATAFVFPSTEEGLGMPPLEAMAAGCPTMMARSSSLIELADDDLAYFDGEDVDAIARALSQLVEDEHLRRHLVELGARSAQRLTWQAAARRTWSALAAVTDSSRSGARSAQDEPAPPATDVATLKDLPRPLDLDEWGLIAPGTASLDGTGPHFASPDATWLRPLLAQATALCTDDAARCRQVLSAGVLDQPVISRRLEPFAHRHDLYAALRLRLPGVELTAEEASALVQALSLPPRWMLERPRSVVLLLSDRWHDRSWANALSKIGDEEGVDVVVAAPDAWGSARSVDVVAVDTSALTLDYLLDARCHGTTVAAIAEPGTEPPGWVERISLDGAPEEPAAWRATLRRQSQRGRTTGWPSRRQRS
jgi:glycosyltransferase involved in cell wall biosynthesis